MDTTLAEVVAAVWPLPMELAQYANATVFRLRLRKNGAPHIPTDSVTFSMLDSNGTAIVDAASATIGTTECTYSASGANLTHPLGQGYMVRWIADGQTYDIPLAICRRLPYMPISDEDIEMRWTYLKNNQRGSLVRSQPTWQPERVDAWRTILNRLIESGRLPWLVLSQSSWREAMIQLTGARIHENLGARGNVVMLDRARELESRFETAWSRIRLDYDEDDDGNIDDADRRLGSEGSLWLGGAPDVPYYYRGWRR